MKRIITILTFVFYALFSFAQESLDFYLPNDVTYDKSIPTPEDFFEHRIGMWHLNYEQVLTYLNEVSRLSDRVIIQEYARSWENRPLVHLIYTSETNHQNLDALKSLHLKNANPDENTEEQDVPLVVKLGYGVHGNESSASNSSVLTAYYLAAAQGAKINELLENTIILVDPCLNPDGFTRHSTWANMYQSENTTGDYNSIQFNEVWPGGRGNHYWFDLNRDYLLLVNPESKGRITKFHEWLPNIVTDHHEMGSNSTFFFQPGVPSRNNPLTPENNYVLTHKIAAYHAEFLDKIGTPYFSEEQFDDYYFGKGSSYPDVNGGVGILFEQAGYRGRIRETSNGVKKLSYGIKNQFTVTLSTLQAAMDLKNDLLEHQKTFYQEARKLAAGESTKAYIFGNQHDKLRTFQLAKLLRQHQVEMYLNKSDYEINDKMFLAESSFIVPSDQNQYRLIKSIFEEATSFTDSTFYDVSTWNFPFTFNVDFAKINSLKDLDSEIVNNISIPEGKVIGGKSKIAYLLEWNEYTAPQALYAIQRAGLKTKVATRLFSFEIEEELKAFGFGTILIEANHQPVIGEELYRLIQNTAKETGVDFYGLKTGLSPEGIDLGSNSFAPLKKPEILVFMGGSTRSTNAGEIWHLFDQRYKIPVTLANTDRMNSMDLSKYNTIVLPTGSYREWDKAEIQKLESWIEKGGILMANQGATDWAAKNDISKTSFKGAAKTDTSLTFNYADRYKERNINRISGAIFNTSIDNSHPICYGYSGNSIPVFKSGSSVAKTLDIKHAEPIKFSSDPFLSGFVSNENLERIKNAPVISVQSVGGGKIISYHENMTFRGIWLGTNKLLANGVFFGDIIR